MRAPEPLPVSGTSSVSGNVPQSRVRTRMRTAIVLPLRLATWVANSETMVAVAAALRISSANLDCEVRRRELESSRPYIWAKSLCSQAVT